MGWGVQKGRVVPNFPSEEGRIQPSAEPMGILEIVDMASLLTMGRCPGPGARKNFVHLAQGLSLAPSP